MPGIMIATPCKTGQIFIQTSSAIARLMKECARRDIQTSWSYIVNDPYVHCARDALANRFLDDTECSHLLFVDDDVVFQPSDAFELLKQGVGVISGIYPQKQIDWDAVRRLATEYPKCSGQFLQHMASAPLLFLEGQSGSVSFKNIFRPLEVACVPGGFLLIERRVLEKYRDTYPDRYVNSRYGTKNMTPFFYMGMHKPDRQMIGEDVQFSLKVKEMGEPLYVLPPILLGHVGLHTHDSCPWCASGVQLHKDMGASHE